MRKKALWGAVASVAAGALLLVACGGGGGTSTPAAGGATSLAAPFVIQADIVQGTKNLPADLKATQTCVEENRYAHNAEAVFRVKVIDPVTGKSLDDSALTSVVVKLPNGNDIPMKFGQHPATNPTDSFWAASWTVPADYPSGSVNWSVVATGPNGETATFEPFAVAPSTLMVTDDTYPVAGS